MFFDDNFKGDIFNASPWNNTFWGRPVEDDKLSTIWATMPLKNDSDNLHIETLLNMPLQ